METTTPQAADVKVAKPQELSESDKTPVIGDLESAAKGAVEQINHCDQQIVLWQKRKEELKGKMNETLSRIQQQFNGSTPEKSIKAGKDATVPELIKMFLDKNGPSRTKEIKKFLLTQGKRTTPGVALSRLKKEGQIKKQGRGVYTLS